MIVTGLVVGLALNWGLLMNHFAINNDSTIACAPWRLSNFVKSYWDIDGVISMSSLRAEDNILAESRRVASFSFPHTMCVDHTHRLA